MSHPHTLPRSPGAHSARAGPHPVDAYVPYQGQSTCDPTVKPGAKYVIDMLLAHYKIGRNAGIARGCTVGGTSEHKEGRAVDWAVNVANPAQKAAGDAFVAWLTAVGPDGKVAYNARRLGVMYVIWNKRIWNNSSASSGWKPYTGAQPHTDHVHISLSWNGAYQRTSWWTGTALPTEATTRRYVALVYGHLFNRQVDPSGLTTWTTALTSGVPRTAVADSITSSTEYRSGLINGAYREFLGRSAEPAGLAGWLQHMVRGSTIQTMESGFLASPEYYGKAGSTDAGWVQMLYRHVLSREAAPAEIQGWVDRLSQGTSRQAVAMGFLISTERLTTVVDGYYQHLLGRGIDPAGQRTWVSSIQNGVRTEQIIASIVASAEYYLKAENYRGESRRRAIRARHRSPQDDDALERVRTETADRCEAVPEHDDPLGPGRQAAAPQAVAVGDPEHGQVQRAVGAPRDGDPHAVGERRAERGVLTALQRGRPEDLAGPHVPGLHRAVTVHDEAPADPHEDPNRGGAVPQHVTRADVEAAQTLVVLRAHQHHVRRAAVVHLCLHRLAREDGTGGAVRGVPPADRARGPHAEADAGMADDLDGLRTAARSVTLPATELAPVPGVEDHTGAVLDGDDGGVGVDAGAVRPARDPEALERRPPPLRPADELVAGDREPAVRDAQEDDVVLGGVPGQERGGPGQRGEDRAVRGVHGAQRHPVTDRPAAPPDAEAQQAPRVVR